MIKMLIKYYPNLDKQIPQDGCQINLLKRETKIVYYLVVDQKSLKDLF